MDSLEELRNATLLQKDFTEPAVGTDGLQFYNLDPVVKHLYPFETPFRNMVPRNAEGRGTATRWKAITGINTDQQYPGVSEGNRASAILHTTADYYATYAGLGHEDFVNFEADYASKGLIDVNDEARIGLLMATMLSEEDVLLAGNATALGTVGAVTGVASGSGSGLPADQYFVNVCALTKAGYDRAALGATGVPGQVTKTNMDGSSDTVNGGNTALGTEGNVTTTVEDKITWTVPAVRGAYAYAWFGGLATGAANLYISAITTTNVWEMTAVPAVAGMQGNNAALAADYSGDSLVFDGLLAQVQKSTSGAFFGSADNAGFTVDASGSCDILDEMLQYLWDTNKQRIGGTEILMNATTFVDLSKKILGTANNIPNWSINITPDTKTVPVGAVMGGYLNKWSRQSLPIKIVGLQDGQVIVVTRNLPFPRNGVTGTMVVEQRQPYYSITWPLQKRRWEYGVYVDECLKVMAPFSFASYSNIAVTA